MDHFGQMPTYFTLVNLSKLGLCLQCRSGLPISAADDYHHLLAKTIGSLTASDSLTELVDSFSGDHS